MAQPSFRGLLSKNGATAQDTTKAIQKLIKDYDTVEASIPEIQKQLKTAPADKKAGLEQDLQEAKDALPLLDTKIVEAVNAWLPRREKIANNLAAMKKGRDAKAGGAKP